MTVQCYGVTGMSAGLPKYIVVNLKTLSDKFSEGEEVSLDTMSQKRMLNLSGREAKLPLKVSDICKLSDGAADISNVRDFAWYQCNAIICFARQALATCHTAHASSGLKACQTLFGGSFHIGL